MLRCSPFFDAVFVVNLRRRPDRWKSILSECQKAGLICERSSTSASLHQIEAYDGSLFSESAMRNSGLLSPIAIERMTTLPTSERIWGMDMTPGAVGCAFSHVDIWCEVAKRKFKRALVLEDDCLLPESFMRTVELSVWDSVPSDWRYLFLSGLDPEHQCPFLRVARCRSSSLSSSSLPRFICRVPRIYRTTNCYMVNEQGAMELLQKCVPFTFQLDTAMTTMLVDSNSKSVRFPPDPKLLDRDSAVINGRSADEIAAMKSEFVSLISCYCVDPPVAAQATRFGSDIQWKNPHAGENHDFAAEEKSRLRATGEHDF